MKTGHHEHHQYDPKHVSCFVLTVSDTRTPQTDESGRTIIEHLKGEGHSIAGYTIVKDDAKKVIQTIQKAIKDASPDAIIANGGTGISPRDFTYEAIDKIVEKKLPGFGELFRHLSFGEIGPKAILSRATAGIILGKLVFSIPGSPAAVRLAMGKIILPILPHAMGELLKQVR